MIRSCLELIEVDLAYAGLADLEDEGSSLSETEGVDILPAHAVEEMFLPTGHLQSDVTDDLLDGGLVHLSGVMASGASLAVAHPAGPDGLRDLAAQFVVASLDEYGRTVKCDVCETGVYACHDLRCLELHGTVDHGKCQLTDFAVEFGLDALAFLKFKFSLHLLLPLGNLGLNPRTDEEVLRLHGIDRISDSFSISAQHVEGVLAQRTGFFR